MKNENAYHYCSSNISKASINQSSMQSNKAEREGRKRRAAALCCRPAFIFFPCCYRPVYDLCFVFDKINLQYLLVVVLFWLLIEFVAILLLSFLRIYHTRRPFRPVSLSECRRYGLCGRVIMREKKNEHCVLLPRHEIYIENCFISSKTHLYLITQKN